MLSVEDPVFKALVLSTEAAAVCQQAKTPKWLSSWGLTVTFRLCGQRQRLSKTWGWLLKSLWSQPTGPLTGLWNLQEPRIRRASRVGDQHLQSGAEWRQKAYCQCVDVRVQVIIAGAGGAAHLPGMVAAMTPLPVIGVPVTPAGAHLDGLDALMSIVQAHLRTDCGAAMLSERRLCLLWLIISALQMPRGVPVATVAIGNAANAGLLAARILGTSQPELLEKMISYQVPIPAMRVVSG